MADVDIKEVVKEVEVLMGGSTSVSINMDDPKMAKLVVWLQMSRVRLNLSKEGFRTDCPAPGTKGKPIVVGRIGSGAAAPLVVNPLPATPEKVAKEPTSVPVPKRHQHSYVAPNVAKDLISVIQDDASLITFLVGPTQCGKTTLVHYVASQMGRKVFQINCRGDMGSELFFGEKTVMIDEETKQNKIVFQKGLIEQAFTEGLDEKGNEVGAPGVLFIDEIAACPAHIAHGLNRIFESDNPRRTMCMADDGGRVVRSHSGLRIIVASNTNGRGASGLAASMYAAQGDALDISLLNRVAVCVRMGYDRKVEERILMEKVGDDKIVKLALKFRDAIRQHIKEGKLTSPFSTAHIIHISDLYRVFKDIGKAIYYATFEMLPEEERVVYNEQAVIVFAKDLLKDFTKDGIDYM